MSTVSTTLYRCILGHTGAEGLSLARGGRMSFAEYTSRAGQGRYCFLRVGNTVVVELA